MVRLRLWFNGVMKRYSLKIMVISIGLEAMRLGKSSILIYTQQSPHALSLSLTEITAAELLEELHKHAELNPYRDDLIGHLNAFIKKRS